MRVDCVASADPASTIKYLVARLQAGTTTVFNSMFERMPFSTLPSAFKWMDDTSNTYCKYETPMIRSFDS